jgi:hypothetical protein
VPAGWRGQLSCPAHGEHRELASEACQCGRQASHLSTGARAHRPRMTSRQWRAAATCMQRSNASPAGSSGRRRRVPCRRVVLMARLYHPGRRALVRRCGLLLAFVRLAKVCPSLRCTLRRRTNARGMRPIRLLFSHMLPTIVGWMAATPDR